MALSSHLIHLVCCAIFPKQKYHHNHHNSSKTVSVTTSYSLSTWPCKWSDLLGLSFIPPLHEHFTSSHLIWTQLWTHSRPILHRRSHGTGCDIRSWKFSFIQLAMMPYLDPVWSLEFLCKVTPKAHDLVQCDLPRNFPDILFSVLKISPWVDLAPYIWF